MYLVVIAWVYVVLMMSVAEATNSNGTVLGALITFVLYGMLPVTLVVYLMGTPARRKAIQKREAQAASTQNTQAMNTPSVADPTTPAEAPSLSPDTSGHTTSDTSIAAVRKKT